MEGRHYTDSIPYETKRLFYEPRFVDMCRKYAASTGFWNQEPEKEKRCRRYLAVAGMYFSFSEELARENDTDAMRKGIEVLEKAAGENMEGQWEAVIWQRLADACYLGGKSGDGEREQDWCQESFLYYERLLCSRQDGNRRKNLLRAAELALQFDMQEKAEQYLNEAAEILGMEEDIFYQQIRKRWEEAR